MNTISTTSPALAANLKPSPANFTRRTPDLTKKFWRNGQWHLIPLYHLLRLSDLACEGIERSGSYRFADHLYRNVASGRGPLGRWLDRRVLNTRAARAMRQRYVRAKEELTLAVQRHSEARPLRVLAIPCGIPRDLFEFAQANPQAAAQIDYTAMDLDAEVLNAAEASLTNTTLHSRRFIQGSALNASDFPTGPFDLILSTGLGEFLDDASLRLFYRNVFASLAEDGVFYTSATAHEGRSDYLMRAFELQAHYRTQQEIKAVLTEQPWGGLKLDRDPSGLQTFVRASR